MATVKKLSRVAVPKNTAGVKTAVTQQTAKPMTTPMRTAPQPVPVSALSIPKKITKATPARPLSKLPPVVQQRAQQAVMQARPIQNQLPPAMTPPSMLSVNAPTVPTNTKTSITAPVTPPSMGNQIPMPTQSLSEIFNRQGILNATPVLNKAMAPIESVPTNPITGQQMTPEDYQKMMEKFFPPGITPPMAIPTPPPMEDFYTSDEYKSYKNPYEMPGSPGMVMAPDMIDYDPIFGEVPLGGGPGGAQYIDYLMRTNQQFGAGLNEFDKGRMQLNPDYLSNYFNQLNDFDRQKQLNQMLQQYQQTQQQQPAVQAISTQPRIF